MTENLALESVVHRLSMADQSAWIEQVRVVCRASPLVRAVAVGGQPMRVRFTSAGPLGWTASASGYAYKATDAQGRPWPAMPAEWSDLATAVAGDHPWDSAIVNWYDADASLGWHVDRSERDRTLPIVTVSLGDSCSWAVRRFEEKPHRTRLESGDVTLLAGRTRNLAHSVEGIIASPMFSPLRWADGTAIPGRISVTIRVAG